MKWYILLILFIIPISYADWPTYQHDEMNTGYTEETLPENISLLWYLDRSELGPEYYPSFLWNTPIYVNGKLYIADALGVYFYAIDANEGKLLWKRKIAEIPENTPQVSCGSPVYYDGNVYVATSVYGSDLWSTFTTIYAFNASNGEEIWKRVVYGTMDLKASIKIYDGKIIYGLHIGRNAPFGMLYVINASNGEIIWKKFVLGAIVGSPCIYKGKIYVAGSPATYGQINPFLFQNRFRDFSIIYCFDLNGNLIWAKVIRGQAKASISAGYGRIYFETLHYFNKIRSLAGGIIYALNATTGKIGWEVEKIHGYRRENDYLTDIAVAHSRIYVNSWEETFCLDAFTGEILWYVGYEYPRFRFPWSPPVICGDRVYVFSEDYITILDALSGELIEELKLSNTGMAGGGFAIGDGKLFRASITGIFAFG